MSISEHLGKDIERHSKKEESRKSEKKGGRRVHHHTVTPAHDGSGYSVETHYEEPMGGGGARMSGEGGPEMSIHKSTASVKKHMDDCEEM